jgi:hypothetical protein
VFGFLGLSDPRFSFLEACHAKRKMQGRSAYKSYDSKDLEPKEKYAGERDARDEGGVERMDERGLGRE